MSTYTQQGADPTQESVKSSDNKTSKDVSAGTATDITSQGGDVIHVSINRRIGGLPPSDIYFPDNSSPPLDLVRKSSVDSTEENRKMASDENSVDTTDRVNNNKMAADINSIKEANNNNLKNKKEATAATNLSENLIHNENLISENKMATTSLSDENSKMMDFATESANIGTSNEVPLSTASSVVVRRLKKGNLKTTSAGTGVGNLEGTGSAQSTTTRRVSFDPLALLLDASLEGELELVQRTAAEVPNPSAANDEGITALHNAICAGHLDIVTFLVTFGCDVNAQDSDGW